MNDRNPSELDSRPRSRELAWEPQRGSSPRSGLRRRRLGPLAITLLALLCGGPLGQAEVPGIRGSSAGTGDERSLAELLARLRADRPETRRSAVKGLAKLQDPKAWAAVIGALSDRNSQVADTAQVVLGELSDRRVLRDLLGRGGLGHKDAWVRLRVAEALGRMPGPMDGERLAKALSTRDGEVSRTLLWSLERLEGRAALSGDRKGLLRRVRGCLGRGGSGALRAQALYLLAVMDGATFDEGCPSALRDRAPEVRAAALLGLERRMPKGSGSAGGGASQAAGQADSTAGDNRGKTSEEAAARRRLIAAARAAAGDRAQGVRVTAAAVLARAATPEALLVLVERLEEEPRFALRARLVAGLQGATGLRYRTDPRPWRRALGKLPPEQRVVPALRSASEAAGRSATSRDRFPLASDRVTYLVDLSGSVWNQRADGQTRKQLVDDMLERTLEALPEEAAFNVLAYTSKAFPWKDKLQPAGRRGRRAAMEFFRKLRVTGPGDVWTATRGLLTDPELDTLCIVTDGAPTGGQRWDMDLMVELFLHETRWSPKRIDVVLVDAPGGLTRRWRELAKRTGGELQELSFRSVAKVK